MRLLSPAIKAASAFTLGGAAFALANLLLARHLSTQDYGHLALVLAITAFSIPLSPLGLDAIVVRHRPGPQSRLLKLSTQTGVISGIMIASVARVTYSIDVGFLLLIIIAIAAGSVTRVVASVYQSEQRYKWSLWLIQSQNIMLILAAIGAGLFINVSVKTVFSAYAAYWVLAAILGWLSLRLRSGLKADETWKVPWGESPPLFGYLVTIQLVAQMDKLIIPKFLDIESLATFGVLSALVLAPFTMFQAGVGYTLIPGLRSAVTKPARKAIAIHEAGTTIFVIVLGVASGFLFAPWVANLFLHGKYEFGRVLIGAAVFTGSLKVLVMFVSSIVTALGNHAQLTWLNRGSWLAVLISIAGGWWGSRLGLPGLIFGFAVGSMVRLAIAALIALRVWRQPEKESRN